ncbi:signal recognition particle-docking protein FtsY [archaeon]|nr:signal recognition particle-docking protein FtsY [archaeon]|tara:strand:+ start:2057 stop:3067 length:1011 start_codon:yes stop_codon:yes gene_type:complete
MFKLLKEKLSKTVSKISETIKKDVETSPEETKEKEDIKKGGIGTAGSDVLKKVKEKVTHKKLSEDKFDKLFQELEITLLENNVAFEVIEKIKDDLKQEILNQPLKRSQISKQIKETLENSIKDLFQEPENLIEKIKHKTEPFVIVFFGVNGVGKTSTIAKFVKLLQKNNLTSILAAADTFRAASQEQIEEWANKLEVPLVKGQYGSDPASVCFDAIQKAKSKNTNVVLIDTAGRMHSNTDLMDELRKIIKVSQPDEKIFVGESITGNDCIDQARLFNEAVDFNSMILTKTDIDEKGGAAISVSYITQKPIIYLTSGQLLDDIVKFDKEKITKTLFG